jgi:type IV secretion system protein VirD4
MNEKNTSIGKARLQGALCALLLIVVVNSICTQFVAYRMTYHSALGAPLFWKVYSPFEWWQWAGNFFSSSPETFSYAAFFCAVGMCVSILIANLMIGLRARSARKHEGTHGTARFSTTDDVKDAELLNQGAGVYCGGFEDDSGRTLYLRHNGPEHVCVIAPTGSGKGVGLVIPTLLSCPDSVFVLDIKGENYAMTAGWRKECAKNIVLRFDPSEKGSCSWNPLGEIRFGTDYQISDAQNIALMVIDSDGKGLFDHWRRAGFELLAGVIMHSLYKSESVGRIPCLKDCANMLTGTGDFAAPEPEYDDTGESGLVALFDEMKNVSFDTSDPIKREAELYIRSIGRSMADKPEKERDSVISTASNELSLYRDNIIGENTSRCDFTVKDLMDHVSPVSLYFITTPDNQLRLRPLIRLLLTRIVAGLTGKMEFDNGRSKTNHKHKLLLMLDEFPSLGRLDMFESALAFIRGYGIKAYIITQDVQQLYKAYTREESIISNCHIRIAYAPNKLETAEWLSRMTGTATVVKQQVSTSGKRFGGVLEQVSTSYQEVQRPLMTPNEIQSMNKANMLVFVAGQPVILGVKTPYYLDPVFSKRSKIAPPEKSDIVRH